MKITLFLCFLINLVTTGCGNLNPSDNWDLPTKKKAPNADWVPLDPNRAYVIRVSPTAGNLAGTQVNGDATTLIITGGNFVSGATVSINGNACTNPLVNSPTQITCTLPPSSSAQGGGYPVIVSNNNGTNPTINPDATYTYKAPPFLINPGICWTTPEGSTLIFGKVSNYNKGDYLSVILTNTNSNICQTPISANTTACPGNVGCILQPGNYGGLGAYATVTDIYGQVSTAQTFYFN